MTEYERGPFLLLSLNECLTRRTFPLIGSCPSARRMRSGGRATERAAFERAET